MKELFKKIAFLILSLFIIFSFSVPTYAIEEGETYLLSSKDGASGQRVYHYGTGEPVTLPTKYFTYEAEMRGVWVATVYNIAIGKQEDTSSSSIIAYQNEFITILDRMSEFGMNTLFFQIRPSNDAFYKSELNPWSEFLVGPGIDPGWDPLEWMIEETHKRGFDFQCWMNAYRVTTESVLPDSTKNASFYSNSELTSFKEQAINKLAEGNFARLHPEYVVMGESDTRLILNPSEPAVQEFIVASLQEIIENYDIDGMHFDDYFYLNGDISSDFVNTNFAGGEKYDSTLSGVNILNDLGNYQEYLNNDTKYSHMERGYTLGDFRRENVNVLMRKIRNMVDKYNQENNDCVEFGSKPAAVWRSNSEYCGGSSRCDVNGSNTASEAYSSYSDIFADTWQWVKEGLVDYVAPQVYYAFEDSYAPYADVVDWWAKMVTELNEKRVAQGLKEIKLYIAHGIYKYRDNKTQFYNAAEIRNQIVYNKKYSVIKGSALYSYENLYVYTSDTHEKGITYLKNNWASKPVYPLPHGEDDSAGLCINNYSITKDTLDNTVKISFPSVEKARVYGVYKVLKGQPFDQSDLNSRILVKYSPYAIGKTESLSISEYDENYDYYVKVVSTNGYISSITTKLDFSNIQEFQSININALSPISCELLCDETININAKVSNPLQKNLTYKVWYYEKGVDKHRLIAEGNVVDDVISFAYKAYGFVTNESSLRIEVTDGTVSTYIDTPQFNTVLTKTCAYVAKTNNLENKYMPSSQIPLDFTINNTSNNPFDYELTLKNIQTDEEKIIEKQENIISPNISINLTNLDEGTYYALIAITQEGKTNYYQTSSFEVSTPHFLDLCKISVNIGEAEVQILVDFPSSCIRQMYKILIVDEEDNEIFEINSGKVLSFNTENYWYFGTSTYKNIKVKVIVGENEWYATSVSDSFSLNVKEETPDNPPINTDDLPTIDNEKGCSCKKNTIVIFNSIICLLGLTIIIRKRK